MVPASSPGTTIYPQWKSDDLKYYWKHYDNPVVERDFGYGQRGWAEALDMARSGNEDAIYMLKRAIKNSRDGVNLEEAAAVLTEIGVEPEYQVPDSRHLDREFKMAPEIPHTSSLARILK